MSRPAKKTPFFADTDDVPRGLNELAELSGMPRTVTWRALRAEVFAAHKVAGLKKAYITHPDSIYAAPQAWEAYKREVHIQNLGRRTDPSSESGS